MEDNKQTAVDRIIERAKSYPSKDIRDYILRIIIQEEESKAMEKEQIEKAFQHSMVAVAVGILLSPEQYYKETYGK